MLPYDLNKQCFYFLLLYGWTPYIAGYLQAFSSHFDLLGTFFHNYNKVIKLKCALPNNLATYK